MRTQNRGKSKSKKGKKFSLPHHNPLFAPDKLGNAHVERIADGAAQACSLGRGGTDKHDLTGGKALQGARGIFQRTGCIEVFPGGEEGEQGVVIHTGKGGGGAAVAVFVIDQHAAHEKVKYEALVKKIREEKYIKIEISFAKLIKLSCFLLISSFKSSRLIDVSSCPGSVSCSSDVS